MGRFLGRFRGSVSKHKRGIFFALSHPCRSQVRRVGMLVYNHFSSMPSSNLQEMSSRGKHLVQVEHLVFGESRGDSEGDSVLDN